MVEFNRQEFLPWLDLQIGFFSRTGLFSGAAGNNRVLACVFSSGVSGGVFTMLARLLMGVGFGVLLSRLALAQSGLVGDQYTVSFSNLRGSVGITVDPETQLPIDHQSDPVAVTFDGVAENVSGILINESATPWSGVAGGIPAVQISKIDGETDFMLVDWENSGELVEFSFETADGKYLSDDDSGQSLISLRGLEWSGTPADVAPTFFNTGWFIYFSTDGQPVSGYETLLPDIGLLVGKHPVRTDQEVFYIAYSSGQVADVTEPIEHGTDLYFGTTQLDETNGSWLLLADVMNVNNVLSIDGLHIGFLVQPPVPTSSTPGDFDGDQLLTAADIDLLTAGIEGTDKRFDLNGDGSVTADDRRLWVEEIKGTFFGDAQLNGDVQFGDFVILAQNFAKSGGWGQGDFDGSGQVQFEDFVLLAQNFGKVSAQAASAVPEPTAGLWLYALLGGLLWKRRPSGPVGGRSG